MEIRYPNYYKKFQCIAGDCPDTCCAGWEIPVDKASELRYRKARLNGTISNKEFAQKLKKHVNQGRIISEDVTCPFLNRQGLCEMYLELGPEALCHTCARHPRHMEDYGNLHEIVLLLSCPEVARLILKENEGGFYVRSLPTREGNMEGIDEELLEILLKMRELIWKWNASEGMSSNVTMALSAALAHDMQRRMKNDDLAGIRVILERYADPEISVKFQKQWNREAAVRFLLMSDFMEEISGLETICRDWPEILENCRLKLYHSNDSRQQYQEKYRHRTDRRPEIEQDKKNLFEYFVYSYVLPALYDDDVLTKVKMAVLCTMAVEEMYMAENVWSLEQRTNLCHAIARQIENCDENRAQLEKILKKELFGARRIINALLEGGE